MNTDQRVQYPRRFFSPVVVEKDAEKLKAKVIYKKEHTKVFNKKLGVYVDDYPLDKYLIKNSRKIIYYTPVKENLYAIIEEKCML